eukprot:scaffold34706_cov165-Amphora_coffeaeformis.AAC.2
MVPIVSSKWRYVALVLVHVTGWQWIVPRWGPVRGPRVGGYIWPAIKHSSFVEGKKPPNQDDT